MFEKVHAQYGLIGLIIAASLGLASAHGQTTGSAIAVDPSGSEYTGGDRASISKTGSWRIELGTASSDTVRALAVAPDGSIYAAGSVANAGFVAHISSTGQRTAWLNVPANVRALAVDPKGLVYAGGDSFLEKLDLQLRPVDTANLPTSATALAVLTDGTLLVAQGSRLLGLAEPFDLGPGTTITGIAVDSSGAVLLTGSTNSLDLPAARNSLNGPADAFVAKIKSDGSAVEWSAYIAGAVSIPVARSRCAPVARSS